MSYSENLDNNSSVSHQYIGSFAWESGILAASFYDTETMELHVTQEGIDLRPDFVYLHNLFRQFVPTYVCISGTQPFIKEIAKLMQISPPDNEQTNFNFRKIFSITSNVAIFAKDETTFLQNRRRVKDIQLPGMASNLTDSERLYFLESVIPIKQTLVVHSIGNLLRYLDVNYRRILLSEATPLISDLKVFVMESQLVVDYTTFIGLQIFSSRYHPSGFKRSKPVADNFSLYALLSKRCSSEIGRQMLKLILEKPTRDKNELNLRYATIEWCHQQINQTHLASLKIYLAKISNLNTIFRKISTDKGQPINWKQFFLCLYYARTIGDIIRNLNQNHVNATILYEMFTLLSDEDATLHQMIFVIDRVCDINESIEQDKFTVQAGLDRELDQKKMDIEVLVTKYSDLIKNQILDFPESVKEIIYYPGFKFVLGIHTWNPALDPISFETDHITSVFIVNDTAVFKTNLCSELDDKYLTLYMDIIEHEQRICGRLVNVIYENLSILQGIIDLCAKLDCLIAMAEISSENNYTRPEITVEKYIEIVEARHPLVEAISSHGFVPTNTVIGRDNYLTILNAPNASGKSVYLKTIGLIVFMAHVGCFVPAKMAKLYLFDGIYSSIYTPESTYYGTSAFLWELQQLSRSLSSSSTNSLILLDEFGKGTNVEEGYALLVSALESLISRGHLMPITLLVTHYSNVYGKLKSNNFAKLKTVEMICDQQNNVTVSTYRIIDGDPNTREASATCTLTATKHILNVILEDSSFMLANDTNKLCEDDSLGRQKIKYAFDLLKKFLEKGSIDENDIF